MLTTLTSKLALNEIDRALVEYGETTSRISLILNSGKKFPLTYIYDSAGGKEEIVNAIEQFIESYKSKQKIDL